MADNLQRNLRAPDRTLAVRINQEPIQNDYRMHQNSSRHRESESDIQQNACKRHRSNNAPRLNNSRGIYDSIRRNFLCGNLNVQNVLNETTAIRNPNEIGRHNSRQIKCIFNRANNVRRNLQSTETPISYHGLVPPSVHEFSHLRVPNASPVAQHLHNATFACQTSNDLVDNLAMTPYASFSYATQCLAKKIGVNLDTILTRRKTSNQTPLSSNRNSTPLTVATVIPPASIRNVSNSHSQTDGNTGSFVLEIPCKDLINLSNTQKDLLLQVMKVGSHSF